MSNIWNEEDEIRTWIIVAHNLTSFDTYEEEIIVYNHFYQHILETKTPFEIEQYKRIITEFKETKNNN